MKNSSNSWSKKVKVKSSCKGWELRIYTGHDPRDDPESYLRWYWNMRGDILAIQKEIDGQLVVVLGDLYDKKRMESVIKQLGVSFGFEEFMGQLWLTESLDESSK